MVSIASHSGRTNSNSMASVISATAGARRLPKRTSAALSSGQVATTIIVAHTVAARNGRNTHRLRAIRATMKSIASVFLARSRRMSINFGSPR
jgi:hypothetical protein